MFFLLLPPEEAPAEILTCPPLPPVFGSSLAPVPPSNLTSPPLPDSPILDVSPASRVIFPPSAPDSSRKPPDLPTIAVIFPPTPPFESPV